MRCPKCNQEMNPHSERCPNCGTSARYAVPDGDTMTRVRRQISEMRRQQETEVSGAVLPDASFSPVLKFDKPASAEPEEVIEDNPADNFPDESFPPVDISGMVPPEEDGSARHRDLAASIRHMINHKEDDLLAEYYFKDGISDLERYRLAQSYERLEQESGRAYDDYHSSRSGYADGYGRYGSGRAGRYSGTGEFRSAGDRGGAEEPQPSEQPEEEMSDAAKRLNNFSDETGVDKILNTIWDKCDAVKEKTHAFFAKNVAARAKKLYDKFDAKTAGFLNGILNKVYYNKFSAMKRKRADNGNEDYLLRRRVWCVVGVVLVLLLCGMLMLHMMLKNDINGKWIVSVDAGGNPNIIMEFKPGGKAAISVKSEDGWHVHKQGKYSIMRKNGHAMLTIVYEDGDVKRLYYMTDGDTGTFINVDTNVQVEYKRK